MSLQRIVLTFKPDGVLEVRVLYRRRSQDGPAPSTKARAREVATLIRTGLERALEALDTGDVALIGTSGFETREDTLSTNQRTV